MDEIKYIEITDGDHTWAFPASVIAKHRAEFYSKNYKDTTYDEEFKYAMEDDYELKDWFLGDMNWEDIQGYAKLVKFPFKFDPDLADENVQSSIKSVMYDK